MKKKHVLLVLPYCGVIFLQTRPKLQQAFEDVLNCCKLLFRFSPFKDPLSKDLIYGVVYKFQCGLCNESYYGENISHLNIRFAEVCHLLLERRSNQSITKLLVIIYFIPINYILFTTSVFWIMRKKAFIRN